MTIGMDKTPRIIVAPHSGFCAGVHAAIAKVQALLHKIPKKRIFLEGELVHNTAVNEDLFRQGVQVLPQICGELHADDVVVIRAHGITQKRREQLCHLGCQIVDATCPFVQNIVHEIVARPDHHILFLGDPNHAEVIGVTSFAKNITVCSDIQTLSAIDLKEGQRYALLCQSTFDPQLFGEAALLCRQKSTDIEIVNTICPATKLRQQGLQSLYACDAAVVIGGRHSANTRRLFENLQHHVAQLWWVESPDEIEGIRWNLYKNIGIAAGASTPSEQIQMVHEKILKSLDDVVKIEKVPLHS
ncbi:MAG: 4-hydroxy-3-methylbut-2-enyl diphosphate reductase [Verrucomicrobiota bacterium]|nr:MAG: 4-hydroxy-3-methylbut-2-enyl diphosphate reductase [Verrucomicrobiota bacterium]